ncbi:alkylhydroperoxidase like protein, AhpD family [Xylanimonas cellulosilytica DSM 15894]|uniref:Alkylhydroperoxidase like protein, AhpD family n=1 Tax=Xylanimonas cellulosilytica (strain DSM 15894 / JCM 12276 / CECT 5975 / KCTC 9989 / LMG 20990 / NBRC 107835 / XIL07) TaxID=446471 RepID=D1BT80_XYLCX|nr:carboxymuconolactone decarboxylase family protein [Xylanimonas cellulosilytica]ACZ30922.1 alkylhydroperoxidase like protein, AhpD family [Xylanimonas cellulosilytica DSM 15894]
MARIVIKSVAPLAYVPALGLEAYAKRNVDKTTFELIKIRASALNGCGYCSAMHTRDAQRAGEAQERIAALAGDWEASGLFTAKESAALRYTDALTRPDGELPDALFDEVTTLWGDKGLVQLAMAIAAVNTWNRLAIGTGMTADDL